MNSFFHQITTNTNDIYVLMYINNRLLFYGTTVNISNKKYIVISAVFTYIRVIYNIMTDTIMMCSVIHIQKKHTTTDEDYNDNRQKNSSSLLTKKKYILTSAVFTYISVIYNIMTDTIVMC